VIELADPSTPLTIQDLVDTLRDWEAQALNMNEPKIMDAAGKDDIGGGKEVEVTVTLLDAVVQFEARSGPSYVQCMVDGGNLTALDTAGNAIDPIQSTVFTQTVRTNVSSSVAI